MTLPDPAARRSRAGRVARSTLAALGLAFAVPIASPAAAQITVYDPANYAQNVLTAARTLQQINNQIRSLQQQATMLTNQAKNLTTIRFPEVEAITGTLRQIDQLMEQAQGIQFRVSTTDDQFRRLFPTSFDHALTTDSQVATARSQMEASIAAFGQTMAVQSQIVGNVQDDAQTLTAIVARSQSAQGALQVNQASNQLLALAAKQQFQIQTLMAAQYRAQAIDQAQRVSARAAAQAATARFLGSGTAYTPQ